jgi:hypothetical protein
MTTKSSSTGLDQAEASSIGLSGLNQRMLVSPMPRLSGDEEGQERKDKFNV